MEFFLVPSKQTTLELVRDTRRSAYQLSIRSWVVGEKWVTIPRWVTISLALALFNAKTEAQAP